jgi:hypothetical protein
MIGMRVCWLCFYAQVDLTASADQAQKTGKMLGQSTIARQLPRRSSIALPTHFCIE